MTKIKFSKKCIFLAVLALFFTTAYPAYSVRFFEVGSILPRFKIGLPDSQEDRNYLGVQDSKKEILLSDLPGKVIILEFFSVYCPVCHQQAPVANKLYKIIEGDDDLKGDVRMIAIGVGNKPDQIQAYKKKFDISFPIIADANSAIITAAGVENIPQTLILDKNNKVLANHIGLITDIDQFLHEVRQFCQNP